MSGAGPFAGRVALVTGGAAGVGRAIAEDLARRGALVAIADRDARAAHGLAEAIGTRGGRALAVETDVLDEASLERMLAVGMGPAGPAAKPVCRRKPYACS